MADNNSRRRGARSRGRGGSSSQTAPQRMTRAATRAALTAAVSGASTGNGSNDQMNTAASQTNPPAAASRTGTIQNSTQNTTRPRSRVANARAAVASTAMATSGQGNVSNGSTTSRAGTRNRNARTAANPASDSANVPQPPQTPARATSSMNNNGTQAANSATVDGNTADGNAQDGQTRDSQPLNQPPMTPAGRSIRSATIDISGDPQRRQQQRQQDAVGNVRDPLAYNPSDAINMRLSSGQPQSTISHILDEVLNQNTNIDTAIRLLNNIIMYHSVIVNQVDIAVVYIFQRLMNDKRYIDLCSHDSTLLARMQPLIQHGRRANSARNRMYDNIAHLRQYLGTDYFNAFFFDEMTPGVSDALQHLCNWAYNNMIGTDDLMDLLNRVRARRILQPPARGHSYVSGLQPIDCTDTQDVIRTALQNGNINWIPNSGFDRLVATLLPPLPAQQNWIAVHNNRLTRNGAPLLIDAGGFLHSGRIPPEINNLPASQFPFPNVPRQRRGAGTRAPQTTGDITAILANNLQAQLNAVLGAPTTVTDTVDTQAQDTSTDQQTHVDDGDDDGDDDTGGQSQPATRTSRTRRRPATGLNVSAPSQARTIVQAGPSSQALPGSFIIPRPSDTYTLGSGRTAFPSGLVSASTFTQQQFGLRATTRGSAVPSFRLVDDLSASLFTSPSQLEQTLATWNHSVLSNFQNPNVNLTVPDAAIQDARCNDDFTNTLLRYDSALVPNCNVGGTNPVLSRTNMPYLSILAMFVSLQTINMMNRTRPPMWIENVQAIITEVGHHFGSGHRRAVQISTTVHGDNVSIWPSALNMDTFVTDHGGYSGWLGGNFMVQILRHIFRSQRSVQVLDGDQFTDFFYPNANTPTIAQFPPSVPRTAGRGSRVVVPFNPRINHWMLLILDFDTQQWNILDSVGRGRGYDSIVTNAINHMGGDATQWTRGTERSQRQANLADCGFWTIANAVAMISRGTAAGPQDTGDLRTWVLRIAAQALMNTPRPSGSAPQRPAPWLTADQSTADDFYSTITIQQPRVPGTDNGGDHDGGDHNGNDDQGDDGGNDGGHNGGDDGNDDGGNDGHGGDHNGGNDQSNPNNDEQDHSHDDVFHDVDDTINPADQTDGQQPQTNQQPDTSQVSQDPTVGSQPPATINDAREPDHSQSNLDDHPDPNVLQSSPPGRLSLLDIDSSPTPIRNPPSPLSPGAIQSLLE